MTMLRVILMLLMPVCESDNDYTDICIIPNDAKCAKCANELRDRNCDCRDTEGTYPATNIFHDVKRCCIDQIENYNCTWTTHDDNNYSYIRGTDHWRFPPFTINNWKRNTQHWRKCNGDGAAWVNVLTRLSKYIVLVLINQSINQSVSRMAHPLICN